MPTVIRLASNSAVLLAFILSTGCAPTRIKNPQPIPLSAAGKIKFLIEADQPSTLPIGLNEQVSKNLSEWHYPIGNDHEPSYSHTLTAHVGSIERASPPTGLSFSAGNSDPRSIDFQKMDVLPVNCELTSNTNKTLINDLSMGFTATETDRRAFAKDKLAEHVSTVCFNLLREVKWPIPAEKNTTAQTVQPSWMPEIRIESKTVPASQTTTPADLAPAQSSEPTNKSQDNTDQTTPTTETESTDDDLKREIIIHNQGSPIILHFGHDRR